MREECPGLGGEESLLLDLRYRDEGEGEGGVASGQTSGAGCDRYESGEKEESKPTLLRLQ